MTKSESSSLTISTPPRAIATTRPTKIPRLNHILIYKDLGFSLEQIARILDGNLSEQQLIELLRSKQTELLQHVREGHARLARIDARLRQGDQETTWSPTM